MALSIESIKYSLKNLNHRKTRSVLTILSIFIGIATIFIFISFGWGLYDYVNSFVSGTSADKVLIQPAGVDSAGLDDTFSLTEQDLNAVKRTQGVYEATGAYIKAAEIQKNKIKKFVFIVGIDPRTNLLNEINSLNIEKGRDLQTSDRGKVVLGHNYLLANKIFPQALEINQKILIQGKEFTVVGFYESLGNPQDDSQIYTTDNSLLEIYPNVTGYSWIIAKVDKENIAQVVSKIEDSVRKSRNLEEGKEDFFVSSFEDLLASYMGALNIIIGFVILIALISVIVSGVNTANTMITSVLERIKEIGVIKAIGARNSELIKIFLFESAFLGFVAGSIGVLVGWVLTTIAGSILTNLGWGFLSPHHSLSLFIGCILFATITGALSGLIPAINASRTNIVDALRYE